MRIACAHWTPYRVGGAEEYLALVMPALGERGHEVSLWYEQDGVCERERIAAGNSIFSSPIRYLRAWQPDIVFCHHLEDPAQEAELLEIAPTVLFAHSYAASCISGQRTHLFPLIQPCERTLGWQCLLHFYPHRCGGLSPATMLRDYTIARRRLSVHARHTAVVTHSEFMAGIYARHGIECRRIRFAVNPAGAPDSPPDRQPGAEWRFLMLSRMSDVKGGQVLLEALPRVAEQLGCGVRLVMAGDGPSRPAWQAKAEAIGRRSSGIKVDFPGWISGEERLKLLAGTDVLVMPSLWPEPFGMAGPEAGLFGVPAVGFRTGGIPDWLGEGENGCLAELKPDPIANLANALIRCVADPARYAGMREKAHAVAKRLSVECHLDELTRVFESVADAHQRTRMTTAAPEAAMCVGNTGERGLG